MATIDLARLRRRRSTSVSVRVAADAEIWSGSELAFAAPVEIEAAAAVTAEGGVEVRGLWKAPLLYDCSRCLEALSLTVERPLALLFVPRSGWETSDPDVRAVDVRQATLDLTDAIREEVLLEAPRYYAPREREDGRCAHCGDPVEKYARAPSPEPGGDADPRWDALRRLQRNPETR